MAADDRILPVIMAGGSGTRLWPLSRETMPKQFQPLTGPLSTYQLALQRVADPELFHPPLVVTSARYRFLARRQAAEAGLAARIVAEPVRRDSAAAIAVATAMAARERPGGLVLALAADHLIGDAAAFHEAVRRGAGAAADAAIVVFGIAPERPETAYGYIRPGAAIGDDVYRVEEFVEKPDIERATAYVEAGFLWNSGNFLFRSDVMEGALRDHAPEVLEAAQAAVDGAISADGIVSLHMPSFTRSPKISIDYAVIEKARRVSVVKAAYRWTDIGSWAALATVLPHDAAGNSLVGRGVLRDVRNSLVHSHEPLTVAVGVEDLAIVATRDAVLVAPKSRAGEVKAIAEALAAAAVTEATGDAAGAFPAPAIQASPNSAAFETTPLIRPTGFREYDARWWVGHGGDAPPPDLNLMGVQALGMGLGTLLAERGCAGGVVTGHDYRSYSMAIKIALCQGLMAAGCQVHDIGLAITPMAYFAQFALDLPAVAMVTASHNDNGWTGVKMGCDRPLTFGPELMARLRDIVVAGRYRLTDGGGYRFVADFPARYAADLARRPRFSRRIKAVVDCGNGTAGIFVPDILAALGIEVVQVNTAPDHRFPHYNPNPEDMAMLTAIGAAVRAHRADLGVGFDGDGDRCGVVDNEGHEIFADKIGVLLARDLSALHRGSRFVADVKSTGLFATDPVLRANGAATDYFKTGHSYIKRRVRDLGALAGFEKSGHFFFGPPIGRGYDDAAVTALAVLDMLDRNPGTTLADLYRTLPATWGSPTMSAPCADEIKYDVVDRVAARIAGRAERGEPVAGQKIASISTVNGIRFAVADGSWGLVRASSNKPELVVVVESPVSAARLRDLFAAVDAILRQEPSVGPYNQTIAP